MYICFLLVDGQTGFELTQEDSKIVGILGQNVRLQWNIIKINETDTLYAADLILVGNTDTKLFVLGGDTKQSLTSAGKKLFGDRITAHINDGKTYILTLQNLNFSDEKSFRLEVLILANAVATISFRKATIQLSVRGLFLIIIKNILFLKSWKQYLNKF